MKLSRTSNKALVLSTALMVFMALVLPFAGIANAQAATVELTPPADTAATGTCNEFTADVNEADGTPAEGETITIRAAQSDGDTAQDLEIAFCDPNEGTTEQGDVLVGIADCDDNVESNTNNDPNENDGGCPPDPLVDPGVAGEAPAVIEGECATRTGTGTTDEGAGQCTFGVESDEAGNMLVEACGTDEFGRQVCDESLKTWVAGGAENVESLDCEPETDTNPEGTEHFITCTATNADGVAIADVVVQAEVTAGPNEGTDLVCGQVTRNNQGVVTGRTTTGQTNNEGQVECWYTDANDGDVGTDTIVAWVDQDSPTTNVAGEPDAGEPQDTVTKNWTGAGRVINCEPETAQNPSGTTHTVTCTVTDREGQPVAGETVTFFEEGPGRFDTSTTTTTDANGVATATVSTFENEEGIQEILGTLTQTTNADECELGANQPNAGDVAGVCQDEVVKNWVAGDVQPDPECSDGVDNDGDGQIDFPNDPGCDSATDNNESDFPNQQFGGETGVVVTEGACAGFTTGSVQASTTTSGLVIVGTDGPDALEGSNADDLICALGGDDAVQGLGGDDTIYGGGGKDGIEAGAGNDTVFGEGDKDIVLGDDGNDTLNGGQGNDNMSGGGGADVLRGQGGWDTLKGNAGNDLLVGAKGRDILQGGGGADTARGGADDDVLKGYIGNDVLRGGGGDDIIKGSRGQDRLFGNAGNDYLHGGPGNDFCRGGRGRNDVLVSCP